MKTNNLMTSLVAMFVTMLSISLLSCSKEDGDSKYSLPPSMMGTWAGSETSDSRNFLILVLFSDGTSQVMRLQNGETVTDQRGGKWAYDNSANTLVVGSTGDKAYHYIVSNFTGSSMDLQTNTNKGNVWTFNMTLRYSASSGSSSGSSGSSGGSSSSGDRAKECRWCMGTGECREVLVTDNACWGDGECDYCDGTGWKNRKKGEGCLYCAIPGGDNYPGNGKCHYCKGSGDCKHCNGTGLR